MEPWTLVGSRPGPAGFVSVRTDRYQLADGTECDWDIVAGPDSVGPPGMRRRGRPGWDELIQWDRG